VFGLVPLVAGTLASSAVALAIALPVGIGTAAFIRYYAPASIARVGESILGVAGGLPSVLYGLFGTVWLVPRFGPSLIVAAIILAAMILPTFTLLTLSALRQVPAETLRAGAALGLRKEQRIFRLALAVTRAHWIAAAGVAWTRALGEALAVEMVCGNVAGLPTAWTDPIRTLTTTLVQEFDYAAGLHRSALHLVALTVVLLAVASATLSVRLAARGGTA